MKATLHCKLLPFLYMHYYCTAHSHTNGVELAVQGCFCQKNIRKAPADNAPMLSPLLNPFLPPLPLFEITASICHPARIIGFSNTGQDRQKEKKSVTST